MLLSLELGWPGPPQGLNNLKISPHFIYGAANLALTAGSHSQSHRSPGRLEARSEACSALFLKPKQDYLISLTPLLPGGSDSKVSAYNVGAPGLIPGSGRSHGEGSGNPLQYSCLENPMDRGAW